ncbi:MAG TPA: hypothetical protein VN154_02315 [Rhizomicrobium sp.]|nr:hypothetical protein [Rhizomicrobium sp.]
MSKPVSTNACDRLVSVLLNPRKMVSSGPYYRPMPRKYATALHTSVHADNDEAVAKVFMLN